MTQPTDTLPINSASQDNPAPQADPALQPAEPTLAHLNLPEFANLPVEAHTLEHLPPDLRARVAPIAADHAAYAEIASSTSFAAFQAATTHHAAIADTARARLAMRNEVSAYLASDYAAYPERRAIRFASNGMFAVVVPANLVRGDRVEGITIGGKRALFFHRFNMAVSASVRMYDNDTKETTSRLDYIEPNRAMLRTAKRYLVQNARDAYALFGVPVYRVVLGRETVLTAQHNGQTLYFGVIPLNNIHNALASDFPQTVHLPALTLPFSTEAEALLDRSLMVEWLRQLGAGRRNAKQLAELAEGVPNPLSYTHGDAASVIDVAKPMRTTVVYNDAGRVVVQPFKPAEAAPESTVRPAMPKTPEALLSAVSAMKERYPRFMKKIARVRRPSPDSGLGGLPKVEFKPDVKALLLEALRSGRYKKITGMLGAEDDEVTPLGLLVTLWGEAVDGAGWPKLDPSVYAELPKALYDWALVDGASARATLWVKALHTAYFCDPEVPQDEVDDAAPSFAEVADLVEACF